MTIQGLGHVAIGVRDMDRMRDFYRDVIGLAVRCDEIEVFEPSENLPEVRRRGVYLQYGGELGGGFVVLDQQLSRQPFGAPAEMYQRGVHHFALWTDDLDAIADRAAASGIDPLVAPMTADSRLFGWPGGGRLRSLLLKDPEGNVVQLDQWLIAPPGIDISFDGAPA